MVTVDGSETDFVPSTFELVVFLVVDFDDRIMSNLTSGLMFDILTEYAIFDVEVAPLRIDEATDDVL